ncbi:DUF5625 family protein [Janthinobacterium sp. PC23-8]|uniref:DUF5625 family protein n=1 Tax=Janthinobacterium sp. PC23-8 TaxID=2012679 RepID=UPI0011403C03|nr:DUF5625 family protein [Janthinobacterium sp. PC23-8]
MLKSYKVLRIIKTFWMGTLFFFSMIACAEQTRILKPPFEMPFSLDKGDEVAEFEIRIVEKQTYTFGLGFHFNRKDPNDSWRVLRLVGTSTKNSHTGEYVDLGEPLKLRLQIKSIGEDGLSFDFDKNESKIGNYAADGKSFDKKITNILLAPGTYKVRLTNLMAAPAMQGTPITIHLRRAYLGK